MFQLSFYSLPVPLHLLLKSDITEFYKLMYNLLRMLNLDYDTRTNYLEWKINIENQRIPTFMFKIYLPLCPTRTNCLFNVYRIYKCPSLPYHSIHPYSLLFCLSWVFACNVCLMSACFFARWVDICFYKTRIF